MIFKRISFLQWEIFNTNIEKHFNTKNYRTSKTQSKMNIYLLIVRKHFSEKSHKEKLSARIKKKGLDEKNIGHTSFEEKLESTLILKIYSK